jgi:hypothetical protein
MKLRIRNPAGAYGDLSIPVVSGDSTSVVAGKIRASATAATFHTLSGSGANVIFTQRDAMENWHVVEVIANGTGVAGTSSLNSQAVSAIVTAEIISIAGTTFTLSSNATATVSGAIVSHNDVPAIHAARDAVTAGQVLYLPEGRYRIDSSLVFSGGFSGKTVRGDGPLLSVLEQHSAGGVVIGHLDGVSTPDVLPVKATGGLTDGSTSITLEGAGDQWQGDLTVGKLIWLMVGRDDTLPVFSVYGYDAVSNEPTPTNQMVRITSKTVNSATSMTVGITPPLLDSYGGGALEIWINRAVFQATSIGMEGIGVDASSYVAASRGIQLGGTFGSWLYDCKSSAILNYALDANCILQCEVRRCHIRGSGGFASNGAGILFYGHSCLFEDNIAENAFPVLEMNGGAAGNVFTYNYGPQLGAWNTNHGPHNQWNVFEGNAIGHQISDGYFGGDAYLTFFRNVIDDPYGVNLKRFNRKTSIVGNILIREVTGAEAGNPFITSGHYEGTAQNSLADYGRDWNMTATLTTRTNDSNGVLTIDSPGMLFSPGPSNSQTIRIKWGTDFATFASCQVVTSSPTAADREPTATIVRTGGTVLPPADTVVQVFAGSFYDVSFTDGSIIGSYPERDLDVGATMVQKGNYSIDLEEITTPAGEALPDSLVYDAAPDWWPGEFAWPPYDPASPADREPERIPAGYRYFNGEAEPAVATPAHSPAGGSYSSPQTITITCSTPDTTIYYTTDGSTPDDGDTVVSGTVAVGYGTTVLKSIASDGVDFSAVRTSTYTIAVATPVHSPDTGTYAETQNVTITSATSGATIYYTTDGSTPDATDTEYSTAIAIAATTTLKSIAFDGADFSAVRTSVYTIEDDPDPPTGAAGLRIGGKILRIDGARLTVGTQV